MQGEGIGRGGGSLQGVLDVVFVYLGTPQTLRTDLANAWNKFQDTVPAVRIEKVVCLDEKSRGRSDDEIKVENQSGNKY